MEGTRLRLCSRALYHICALQSAIALRQYAIHELPRPGLSMGLLLELIIPQPIPIHSRDFRLLQLCLRGQLGFWGFTHRTMESLASAGSTLMEPVATRKIDPTHGEGLLGKSPISPYLVPCRSRSSRCPSRSGTVSVEDLACRLWACLSGLPRVALLEFERGSSVPLGSRGSTSRCG